MKFTGKREGQGASHDSLHYDAKDARFRALLLTIRHAVIDDEMYETSSERDEAMGMIGREIQSWLSDLWHASLQQDVDVASVHKCLQLCESAMRELEDHIDDNLPEIELLDSSGDVVYGHDADYITAIVLVWTELFLSALATEKDEVLSQVKSALQGMDWRLLTEIQGLARGDAVAVMDSKKWSDNKGRAARSLLTLIEKRVIADFNEKPSAMTYKNLRQEVFSLRGPLLDAARRHFFDGTSAISWTDAIEIFLNLDRSGYMFLLDAARKHAFKDEVERSISWGDAMQIFAESTAIDDILRLLRFMPDVTVDPTTEPARIHALTYLDKRGPEIHGVALSFLRKGLEETRRLFWREVRGAFSGFDDASQYLADHITNGTLSRKKEERDPVINAAADQASVRALPEPNHSRAQHRHIKGNLKCWIDCLDHWSSREEAVVLWNEVFGPDMNHPLYSVDGFAKTLALRCDGVSRKGLGTALRNAYNIFKAKKPTQAPQAGQKRGNEALGASNEAGPSKRQRQTQRRQQQSAPSAIGTGNI